MGRDTTAQAPEEVARRGEVVCHTHRQFTVANKFMQPTSRKRVIFLLFVPTFSNDKRF